MPKNLLIGAITNYVWDDIAPFFNSYMQAGFENCDCVMFTGSMSERTLEKLRKCGVITLPIPEHFIDGCIIDYRWKLYRDYLSKHAGNYGMVFTADVRDVFFQRDVFRCYDDSREFLGVALEDGDLTESCNKNWLTKRYGEAVHESIKDNRIICMGTVWGTENEFLAFASKVTEHINSTEYPYFKICDQASGNWLIYHEGMFANVLRPSTNQDGPVMTIGLTKAEDVHIDAQGFVLNGRGEIAAVVHQYDRKPEVINIVIEKYGRDISMLAKLSMKSKSHSLLRRVMNFKRRAHNKGLIVSVIETIRNKLRRVHR